MERVAGKIGMITRRATQVLAGPKMPRSATQGAPDFTATRVGQGFMGDLLCQAPREGAPWSVARGTREAGSGSGGDAATAAMKFTAFIPLRGRIFLRKKLLGPPRSYHSLRRLSRIPSRKAIVAPTMTYSEVP